LGKYTKKSPRFFENIREIDGVKEKRCTQCQEWFPETTEYFYMRNKKKPERGFNSECKKCTTQNTKNYFMKNKEIELEKRKKWKEENKNKNLSYMHKSYQRNKDFRREYLKEWHNKNPEKQKEYLNRHRKHDITITEWLACKKYFNNQCAYCGLPIEKHFAERNNNVFNMDLHKEHVDDNGANDLSNCVPSCQSCNSTKNLKTLEEIIELKIIEKFTQEKYNKINK